MAATARPDARSMFSDMKKKSALRNEKSEIKLEESTSISKAPEINPLEDNKEVAENVSILEVATETRLPSVASYEPQEELKTVYKEQLPITKQKPQKRGTGKLGRPPYLGDNKTTLSISFPDDIYEMIQIGKKSCGGNAASYIRTVIAADFARNGEYYKNLPEIR